LSITSTFSDSRHSSYERTRLDRRDDARTCGDDRAIANDKRRARRPIDDGRTSTDEHILADADVAGDVDSRRDGREIADHNVMAERATHVDMDVTPDPDIRRHNCSSADD
jgi:hypothetical protein